jgi:hypothetical protein
MRWEHVPVTSDTRTCPSELFGSGILGIETEASKRCSMSGLGSSSSSYSKASLRFRSGEVSPSSGGGAEKGEESLDSGALGAPEARWWSLFGLNKSVQERRERGL